MLEWNEKKKDFLYNMVERYDKESIEATDQLYRLLISFDVPLIVHMKRLDLETLGPRLLRPL